MSESRDNDESRDSAETSKPWADVARMLELRRELAEAEIKSDVAATKRLAIVGGSAAVAALSGLPLLLTVVALQVDRYFELTFPWTAVCLGLLLLIFGALLGWSAWLRFRHDFLGLHESLDELREDLIWLRERFGE